MTMLGVLIVFLTISFLIGERDRRRAESEMRRKLAEAFGKGKLFAVGLLLLTPVFYMILAFGSAQL